MAWTKLRTGETQKFAEAETRRDPKEERILIVQEIPLRDNVRESVSLVLADLAILPNIKRIKPLEGELRKEGVIAVIPVRASEGLWTPDPNIVGAATPDMVEEPAKHAYVDQCLRDWRFMASIGPWGESRPYYIGRDARQIEGADIGVGPSHPDYKFDYISRQRGVGISPSRGSLTLIANTHPFAPISMWRQPLWEPTPEQDIDGRALTLVSTKVPSRTVVDALAEKDQKRVNLFYGGPLSRAWKRFVLDLKKQTRPEVLSPWIGSSTDLVRR